MAVQSREKSVYDIVVVDTACSGLLCAGTSGLSAWPENKYRIGRPRKGALRRLRAIATWLIFFLGLAAVLLGFEGSRNPATANSQWFQMITLGGSALFGASLSLLIEQLLGTDVADIRNYLMRKERFESAPDHLDAVTGEWHHYDQSKVRGKRKWQYLKLSLARGDMHDTLSGEFYQIGPTGKRRKYVVEAGIRGGAMIAIMRAAEGDEHDQIQIIPKITRTHLNAVAGIQIMETWDGDLCQSYCIYSRQKLISNEEPSDQDSVVLDRILAETLAQSGIIDLKLIEPFHGTAGPDKKSFDRNDT